MAWDFSTEPEFQEKLDWVDRFVREEVEPLDLVWPGLEFTPLDETRRKVVDPLKEEVRRRGLWATHLGPDLGGQGYGQLKLALLNEILGRSSWAPIVFGCQAPDTGNAEIIARYGTAEQKARYLRPLLEGEIFSCYSMTEPHAGADPTMFETRAVGHGDEWVIDGWKYFSSNADTASFLIVMAVTDPDVSPYKGMSMFLVPADTPGIEIVRRVGLFGEPLDQGHHALIHYDGVRVPAEALLGGEGQAFAIAQAGQGLQDLGRPDGFHERQVDRWTGFFARVKGRELEGMDVATGWLRTRRPLDYVPGLMHGDYQFANVMYRHGAPAQLAATVDWEMATVGDPKLDLAWMIQSWPEDTAAAEASEAGYVDLRGMPSRSQILAHYAEVSGRQVDDIDYYVILARWKLAIVLEQGFQRAGDDEKLLSFGPIVPELMRSAAELAEATDYGH